MQQDKNATHWVLGGALLLIGLFVIIALVLVRSQSLTPIAQVNINNLPPTIDNIKLCPSTTAIDTCTDTAVDLAVNSLDGNAILLTLSDPNGTGDISTVEAEFYHAMVKSQGGADDKNDHYTPTCSLLSIANSTTAYYRCPLELQYFTDASNIWTVYAKVVDASDSSVASTEANKTVNQLTNATFQGNSINFGTKALGFTTGTADELQVGHYNQGNATSVYFSVSAAGGLVCDTLGTIPAGNVKFNATVGAGYTNAKYTLANVSTNFLNLDIPQRTSDTSASQDALGGFASSFWSIAIPGSGVSGTCTTTVTAIAAAQ